MQSGAVTKEEAGGAMEEDEAVAMAIAVGEAGKVEVGVEAPVVTCALVFAMG